MSTQERQTGQFAAEAHEWRCRRAKLHQQRRDRFNEALHEHPQVQAGHVDGRVTLTVGPLEPMEPMEAPPLLRVRPTGCSYRRVLCKSRFGGDA